jgi:aryl-alcohol dehydrogenase-like predicted oxidoreductase
VNGVDKLVSQIALGTAWFRIAGKEQCFGLMDDFIAQGGTTIDTARIYGESEEVIGLWMEARKNRDRILVITKGGLSENDPARLEAKGFREKVAKDITTSLRALRTDYIDLYFLHRDEPSLPAGEVVECLNAEWARGRIRAFGGSNWEYSRADEANECAEKRGLKGFAAVSNNISLAVPTGPFYPGLVSAHGEGERWHVRTGLPLFAWSSQARGFFSGQFQPGMRETRDGFLRSMIRVYCTDENFERLRRAEQLGRELGAYSAMQVALAWVLHRPYAVVPIVGPRTRDELSGCIAALSIEMDESKAKWLNLE